jgi:hypothetical protein
MMPASAPDGQTAVPGSRNRWRRASRQPPAASR